MRKLDILGGGVYGMEGIEREKKEGSGSMEW